MPAATIDPPTQDEVANVDPMSGGAVNPPPPPAPGPTPARQTATNGAAPPQQSPPAQQPPADQSFEATEAKPGTTWTPTDQLSKDQSQATTQPQTPSQVKPPWKPPDQLATDQSQAAQTQEKPAWTPTDQLSKDQSQAQPSQAQPQHVDTSSFTDDTSTDDQIKAITKQVTENPDIDPNEGAAALYPLLQKQKEEQQKAAGTGEGGAKLADDLTNFIGGAGTGLYHWQGGVRSLANTGDAVARIGANVLGSMPFQDVEDDLKAQLKAGTLDQAGFDAAMAKVNQAQDLRQRQVDLGPGAATTPEGIKAQQDSENQIAQLLTQADQGFVKNHVQQALLEAIHGGKLGFYETARFLDNVLGKDSWDPTTYFGNASTLSRLSQSELANHLREEQKLNVPLAQAKAGKVSPIEQSVANNINALFGHPVVTNDDLIKAGYGMNVDKAEQVADGIKLAMSFLPGMEGEEFAEGALSGTARIPRTAAKIADFTLAKGRKWGGWEYVTQLPHIVFGALRGDWRPLAGAAKEAGVYVAAKATSVLGNATADLLEGAAKNEYQGNPLWYQFGGRSARELVKGGLRGVPYAALTSESPEQFGQNIGAITVLHAIGQVPNIATQGLLGGTGDSLFVQRKGVANRPVDDLAYGVNPATGLPDARLDNISAGNAKTLTNSQRGLYTRVKQMMSPYADIYLTSRAEMDAQRAAFAHTGANIGDTPDAFSVDSASTKTGRAAVFVDPTKFDRAFLHDAVGHPAYWMMPPELRQGLVDLVKTKNDPVAFTKRYNGLDYNSLPTTEEVNSGARKADPSGYTKDLMDQEMAAEQIGQFFNGKKISDWSKNDGAIRQMKNYVGKVLEKYGLDSTTFEANSEAMGLQPSVTSYLLMRDWLRGLAENRGGKEYTPTRVTGGVPPTPEAPPPVTHEAIQQRAYEIGQQRQAAGQPGDETSDWLQAERELQGPTQAPQPSARSYQPSYQATPRFAEPETGPEAAQPTTTQQPPPAPTGGAQPKPTGRTPLPQQPAQPQQQPPPAPGPQPQQPPAEQGPELAGAEPPSAPEPTEADQDTLHAKIRDLTNKGVPAGEAHARAQGKTPQTLQQKQEKSSAEMASTARPAAAKAPAQAAVPITPQTTLKADNKNRVDPRGLYSYLVGKFSKSGLVGYVPPDGARWGIKTGSAAEWAAFGLAVAKQESDLNTKSWNAQDPGGSAGLFQFGQGQTEFTKGGNQFDPQQSADAFVRSVQHFLGNRGRIANMGETFGSIRRPNEAGQYIAGAQKVAAGGTGADLVSSGRGGGGGGGGGLGGGDFAPQTAEQRMANAQAQAAQGAYQPSQSWAQVGHAGETSAAPAAEAPPSGGRYEAPGEAPEENVYSPYQMMAMQQQRAFGLPEIPPPAAPGGRSAAFMPRRKMGGLEPEGEEEEGEPEVSTVGVPHPKGMEKISQLISGGKLAQALKAHSQILSRDDSRVTKQPDNYTKGEHFVEGDPAHEELLGGLPGGKTGRQRNLLAQGEQAIADRSPMHVSYISAPKEAQKFPTRASRTQQYDEHSPEARLMGTTQGQLVGHSMIPTSVGVSPKDPKNGDPHQGYIQGISTNVMANNFRHTNQKLAKMGEQTPYPSMGNKFYNDLEGYVQNLNAGHRGTGEAYAPGTEEYPSKPDENYVPYPLKPQERDFLNTVINNTGAFAKKAQPLRELARKGGTLLTEAGETNPMQQRIERHEPGWRANVLEPSIRSFRTGLIHDIHETEEHMPAEIRPGKEYQELTRSLSRAPIGGAAVPLSVAFMPMAGRMAAGFKQAEKEGKTFYSPIEQAMRAAEEKRGSMAPTQLQPRFEISDRDMKLKDAPEDSDYSTMLEHRYHEDRRGAGIMKLSAALQHPELFKNYPQLKSTKLSLDPTINSDGYYEHPWQDDNGKIQGDHIVVKKADDRDTMAHEIQHAVQYIEGTPKGSSPAEQLQNIWNQPEAVSEVRKMAKDHFPALTRDEYTAAAGGRAAMEGRSLSKSEANDAYHDYLDGISGQRETWTDKRLRKMAFAMYQRTPGEMEARVAGRRAATPEEAGFESPEQALEAEKTKTEFEYPKPPELAGPPAAPGERSAAFMAAKPGAPKAERLKKPDWKNASEEERQAYLEKKVAKRIGEQYVGPETHKLEVKRNEQGGIKYDPDGNPVYVQHDYNIVNSPLLKKKGLDQIKGADEHEDTLGADEHVHLNDVERRRLSALRKASARETMADRIVQSFNSMKDIPEVAAGEGWYSRMRQKLAEHLGEHHELFAQLLGATSAQTPVRENFMQALDALEQFRRGDYDKHIQKYLEAVFHLQMGGKEALTQHMRDEGILRDDQPNHATDADAMAHWIRHHDILPLRQNGAKYNANSNAVLKALAGTWLHEVDAPKTPNFAGNLTGRTLAATIDVWAARHLQRLGYEGMTKGPWRATAAAEPGVSALDFAFSQDAMKRATEKLAEQGIKMNPDDLQAILWYGEKHHYDERGWTRGQGAEKGSFDDVADLAFPKTGEGMNSKQLREHYQKVSLADKALEYESHANPKMRAKLGDYMTKHGLEQHHLERARLDKKQETLAEAA